MIAERILLTAKEVSVLLGVSERTLKRWRQRGEGPPFVTLVDHGGISYERAVLAEYIRCRTRTTESGLSSRTAS